MRLGFLLEPPLANSDYRVILPMHALEGRGHTVLWPQDAARETSLRALKTCDLVHCYRRSDRFADLQMLSRQGIAVSFDNDDDIDAIDTGSGARSLQGRLASRKRFTGYVKTARLADLVTTPSRTLAEKYRALGAEHAVVIENYLERNAPFFGFRSRHDGVVVGWVAALEHQADVPGLKITECLSRLLHTHAHVRVVTVGVRLPLHSARYEHIPSVSHQDLLKVISGMDIGIAPLLDSEFNRSRSNIKLKEYGAGGAAWLASPVGAYRDLGEKQGGLLIDDDGWFGALDRLVRSRLARGRLARRGLRWAKSQIIDRRVGTWEEHFLLAVERANPRMRASASTRAVG